MAVLRTIKSTGEIDTLFQTGTRVATNELVVLAGTTATGRGHEGRVAFIAGRKLGPAVCRNRAKRVMRASVQRLGGPWAGHDVALIARANTGGTSCRDLDAALGRALSRLGIDHE